jgi:uncharacterized metal-binding protein YceD (DUF177 family)
MSATPPQPDIPSFNVHVAVLPRAGLPVELHADEDECARLANACGIEGFDKLEADLLVTRWRRDGVQLRGEIRAIACQQCVVTLEPLTTHLREPVSMTFLPHGSGLSRRGDESSGELILDPEGPDLPESFTGDTIDIWPVVVECLLLAIDPFPRAPDAELEGGVLEDAKGEEGEAEGEDSPFAALKALKSDAERS